MPNYLDLILNTLSQFWLELQHGNVLPIGNWNYIILFILVIIQGPVVKLLSGAVVSNTYLNLFIVILVSIMASLVADSWWYFVGQKGNFEQFFRRKSAKSNRIVQLLLDAMQTHYFKVLLLGKLSMGLALPSIISAGISKIPWRKWFPAVLLGEVIFSSALVLTGFFAAESIGQANQTIKLVGIILTVVLILVLFIYLPRTIRKTLLGEPEMPDNSIDV